MNRIEHDSILNYICMLSRIRNSSQENSVIDKYDFAIRIISDMLHNIGIFVTIEMDINMNITLVKIDTPAKNKSEWKHVGRKKND